MHDILSDSHRDPEKIIEICLKNNSYLHKNLSVKKISEDNFGFFSNENIPSNQKMISIPNKIFISRQIFRNFLIGKNCDYFNKDLLKTYIKFLPNLNYFKKNHFMFLSEEKRKIAYSFFNENTPIKKKIKKTFDKFETLNELEKYIDLVFRSRSFNIHNTQYLLPMLDIVNYEYNSEGLFIDKEDVFFNTCKNLEKKEQFFQKYNSKSNPIYFFINYSFFPEDYYSCLIPKKFISVPTIIDSKNLLKSDWIKDGKNEMTNNSDIFFENLIIPNEFNQLMKVFKSEIKNKVSKQILNLLLNEINYENITNYIKIKDSNYLILMFAKSVNQHYKNILNIISKVK